MKILLLGGTGYVGSAIGNLLENEKHEVVKLGTNTNPKFIIGELFAEEFFNDFDVIIYLAWYFNSNNPEYFNLNFESFNKIAIYCWKNNKKLIFVSTLHSSLNASSIYNKTKAFCEQAAIKYNFQIVRLGTVLIDQNYGNGTYGKIIKLVNTTKIYPRIYPDREIYQITKNEHLVKIIKLLSKTETNPVVLTEGINQKLENVLDLKNKFIFSFPIHFKLIYLILKIIELTKINFSFKSDMVLSIWKDGNN